MLKRCSQCRDLEGDPFLYHSAFDGSICTQDGKGTRVNIDLGKLLDDVFSPDYNSTLLKFGASKEDQPPITQDEF